MWNKLGSQAEVENSEVGLDGTFAGGSFVEGFFPGGAYSAVYTQDLLVTFPKEVVPYDAGTIEFWARLSGFPTGVPYDDANPAFVEIGDGHSSFVVAFTCNDGRGGGGLCGVAGHEFRCSTGDWGWEGSYSYSGILGAGQQEDWHHYALVWDANGIAGVAGGTKNVAIFLDGSLNSGRWYDVWPDNQFVPLVGGELGLIRYGHDLGQAVTAIDNIKIWDYAKTDFSDRFCESPLNEPPFCDADGPYSEECQGATTSIELDGSGSYDPDPNDTLTYSWSSDCPEASFDDPNIAEPILTLTSGGSCQIDCTVCLTVTDTYGATSSDTAPVTVSDTTEPVLTCPASVTVECDGAGNQAELSAWCSEFTRSDACNEVIGLPAEWYILGCGATFTYGRHWWGDDVCGNHAECTPRTFTVVDTTPPVITCPDDVTLTWGDPTDPDATGWATATDICDDDPAVFVYREDLSQLGCLADPVMYRIDRFWRATDECDNFSQCVQTITVLKVVLDLDIKPGSCPNSFNRGSHGVLPIGLLGTDSFDVTTVDLSCVLLLRADCVGGSVAPHEGPPGPHSVFADVGTPFDGELCDCHELTGDGIVDLSMKFRTDDVVEILELDSVPGGSFVPLVITGSLVDGTPFVSHDCLRLVPPGEMQPFNLAAGSNVPGAYLEATPLDNHLDSDGFALFYRSYPAGSPVTLTAPPTCLGRPFVGWKVNGVMQTLGDRVIELTTSDVAIGAKAVYGRQQQRPIEGGQHDALNPVPVQP